MSYLIVILFSYLAGSSNLAYFISHFCGVDLKKKGSGNLGASNATAILGWRVGVLVAVHDILKALLPVLIFRAVFPDLPSVGVLAGLSAVIGHIFPFYLRFRGGKGFASYLGMTIALNWKLALCAIILALMVTVVTDYIALGTISTVLVVPAWTLYRTPSLLLAVLLLASTAVIIYKHKENIPRILNGTEIGLRSTIRGENKIKKQ